MGDAYTLHHSKSLISNSLVYVFSLELYSFMDNRFCEVSLYHLCRCDRISISLAGRKLVSVGTVYLVKVSVLDSWIMCVLYGCLTQLFLGRFLSGLHSLTKDYLIDGSIYLEFKKNGISNARCYQ